MNRVLEGEWVIATAIRIFLGFVHIIPSRARQRILDLAATQLSDGTCYHQYQPLTKKGNADVGGGFNDDPLWLILSTTAYIKETGDTSILNEKVGFADISEGDSTLLDHLHISIYYTLNNLGSTWTSSNWSC